MLFAEQVTVKHDTVNCFSIDSTFIYAVIDDVDLVSQSVESSSNVHPVAYYRVCTYWLRSVFFKYLIFVDYWDQFHFKGRLLDDFFLKFHWFRAITFQWNGQIKKNCNLRPSFLLFKLHENEQSYSIFLISFDVFLIM